MPAASAAGVLAVPKPHLKPTSPVFALSHIAWKRVTTMAVPAATVMRAVSVCAPSASVTSSSFVTVAGEPPSTHATPLRVPYQFERSLAVHDLERTIREQQQEVA